MFSGDEEEKWLRRLDFLKLLQSAAFVRRVGFSGLQEESRQLVQLVLVLRSSLCSGSH